MNFLLKIVEGPNRGAEIALVEGVAVTLGKGDGCDIVLADPTLPDAPLNVAASADGVTLDGEPIGQFTVKTLGATSFAVGPADAPWGDLKWEKAGSGEQESRNEERGTGDGRETPGARQEKDDASRVPGEAPSDGDSPKRRRGGVVGCLVAAVLMLLLLAVLAWLFREALRPHAEKAKAYSQRAWSRVLGSDSDHAADVPRPATLSDIASRYGLELDECDGAAKLSGNFKTRAERLRATAEAYEARPGVDLDLSDDESFRAAADDALFTLTEGAIKVVSATNRMLAIAGPSASPFALRRMLTALGSDIPKLRGVDTAGVVFGGHDVREAIDDGRDAVQAAVASGGASRLAPKSLAVPSLPVCGILTKPYPCLVMRDGSRVLEGAAIGDNVVLKIDADAVTMTNATGRFTWKP